MKIAVVHGFYSSKTPSGENAVVQMQVDALKAAGHNVRLFSVHTDAVSSESLYSAKTAVRVATGWGHNPLKELQAFDPEVVHIHNLFPNFSTRWLRAWTGPLVVTLHNFRPFCAAGNLFREGASCTLCPTKGQIHSIIHKCYRGSALATVPLAIRNRNGARADPLLQRADRLIFLSERARRTYAEYGVDDDRAAIVPNFVKSETTEDSSENESKSWLYAGRLSADKGIAPLIEAWPADVNLNVYGDGPDRALLLEAGRDSVTLHGAVDREAVLSGIRNASGVVIPSLWAEGLPTIYLEALEAGVPVLAKSGNSAADDILSSNSGKVFDSWYDVPQMVNEIESDWTVFSTAARERFEENFTEQMWVSRVEEIYSSLTL